MNMKISKKNVMNTAKALAGGGVGYSLGKWGVYAGLAGALFAPAPWKPAAFAALAGGIAGANQPETGNLMEDIKANAKSYAKGGLKSFFIDKIAPEVVTKLDGLSGGMGNIFNQFYPSAAAQLQQMPVDTSESALRLNQSENLGTVSVSALRIQSAS